jgi:hypothetical protein
VKFLSILSVPQIYFSEAVTTCRSFIFFNLVVRHLPRHANLTGDSTRRARRPLDLRRPIYSAGASEMSTGCGSCCRVARVSRHVPAAGGCVARAVLSQSDAGFTSHVGRLPAGQPARNPGRQFIPRQEDSQFPLTLHFIFVFKKS